MVCKIIFKIVKIFYNQNAESDSHHAVTISKLTTIVTHQ